MPSTRENFWRMIVQEQVSLIVMLTSLKENGKTKRDQYWPDKHYQFDGCYDVQLISQENLMPGLVRRQFRINRESQQHSVVTQLQFEAWPDHGAPD